MQVRDLDSFKTEIRKYGFDNFWSLFIQTYLHKKRPDLQEKPSELDIDMRSNVVAFDNLGELYEIALEYDNQISKKELGQYYTPKDVCQFMAKKTASLFDGKINVLADVCCGTGNLIIEVLSLLDKKVVEKIIKNKKLYLYDLDKNAVQLAIMKVCILFVAKNDVKTYRNIKSLIQVSVGNFLSEKGVLPSNAVVIANPPYGKLPKDMEIWKDCKTLDTNDMYAVFIERIVAQADKAVIITPQSFLGGSKFRVLRKVLSDFGGCVWAFDNVPAGIFCGRKKGIFNTNTANSVRAAITVVDKSRHGFRVSPMIRFKMQERERMFEQLDNLLGDFEYVDSAPWTKIPKSLEPLVKELAKTKLLVADLIEKNPSKQEKQYKITVPSTPRYFISGSRRELDRSSKIEIFAKNEEAFNRLYLMINSTFSYLWWRIYDGGITLTRQTLLAMPVPDLTAGKMKEIVGEGLRMEEDFIVYKMNAGKNNENIKFPDEYRQRVNHLVLSAINFDDLAKNLFSVHSNSLSGVLSFWI